eukprot:COSAG02_NODE_26993_length_619_cov_1.207692_1_plen_67_part_10
MNVSGGFPTVRFRYPAADFGSYRYGTGPSEQEEEARPTVVLAMGLITKVTDDGSTKLRVVLDASGED